MSISHGASDVIHPYNRTLFGSKKKKNEVLVCASTWMNTEIIILQEACHKRQHVA